jgi:hypothetical protein
MLRLLRARGGRARQDLDLIAIVASAARPFSARGADWDTETLPVPVDLLVYTEAEWESLMETGGRFAATLRREARWIPRPGS